MLGRARLRRQDQEDIVQDLTLSMLKSLPAFTGKRGTLEQFASKVLANARANILRDRHAQKRGSGRDVSLSAPQSPDVEIDRRSNLVPTESAELRDLRIDMANQLAKLPPETRRIAEVLKLQKVAPAARRLGMARSTLKSKLAPKGALFEQLKPLI